MDISRLNPFKPFTRTPEEVADILNQAIEGTLDCRKWDTFINVPIKGSASMEAIRARCEELSSTEKISPDGKIWHSPEAKAELLKLLQSIR